MLMETTMATEAETGARISLADIEANIHAQVYLTGLDAVKAAARRTSLGTEQDYEYYARKSVGNSVDNLTICLLVLKNGFIVIGHSVSADPKNYDAAPAGRKMAYDHAVRQIWPLMGYSTMEKLNA
jgi:hypothetical protein